MIKSELQTQLQQLHDQHKKVVLVTGVFDLLHSEHKLFLQKAKKLGDFLVVGVESDVRVRHLKGEGRPVNSQAERQKNLEALPYIDAVFILPEEFSKPEHHDALLAAIRPAVLAVSSHTAHLDKKQKLVEKYGGELVIAHEHNPAVSTTLLLAKRKGK